MVVDGFNKGNISLASLTDILAFHLPFDIDLKLQLLGEVDVLTRAQLLLANLPFDRDDQKGSTSFPPEFSVN